VGHENAFISIFTNSNLSSREAEGICLLLYRETGAKTKQKKRPWDFITRLPFLTCC